MYSICFKMYLYLYDAVNDTNTYDFEYNLVRDVFCKLHWKEFHLTPKATEIHNIQIEPFLDKNRPAGCHVEAFLSMLKDVSQVSSFERT